MTQNKDNKVHLTCKALSGYYQCFNQEYDQLFSVFCDDNGIDEEELYEELQQDPSDCVLTEFDANFPIKYKIDDEQRLIFIFDKIKQCYDNPNIIFDAEPPLFNTDFFKITKDDLMNMCQIYKIQCPVLWNSGMENDSCFKQMLAVGYKQKYNYLQHLIDDYLRDTIKHINESWEIEDWIQQHKHFNVLKNIKLPEMPQISDDNKATNKYLNTNKNKLQTAADFVVTAVNLFGARICQPVILKPSTKINDSLEMTVKYILSGFIFIATILSEADPQKTMRAICPFQIDVCIASNEPKKSDNYFRGKPNNDNDDNDDADEKKQDDDVFVDCVGNIKEKLIKNKLQYKLQEIKHDDELRDINQRRVLIKLFNEMELAQNNKKKTGFYKLHRKRLIVMIDRRNKLNDNDQVYLYLAPKNCRDIPNDAVSEWYFNASKTCLLPNMDYGDGKQAESKIRDKVIGNKEDKLKNSNIESSCHCQGALLTLSFHVRSINEVKCYLYFNGRILRFMPKDIKTVLPTIFNMEWNKGENKRFIQKQEDIDKYIEEMNKTATDIYFDSFTR